MFEPPATPRQNGFTVGHWTDRDARTGCTVVVFNRAAPAVADVRGGAPGTRETDLLGPGRLVQSVDAIVLSGGSAFGLASADGVMAELKTLGQGVGTPAGPVPIVPAAVIFDLAVGAPSWPSSQNGAEAFLNRGPIESLQRGLVGAGTGATTGKLFDPKSSARGGLGYGTIGFGEDRSVHALVVVNAAGIVVDPASGKSALRPGEHVDRSTLLARISPPGERSSTTLAVVIVDAPCDRRTLERAGVAAHDAFARAIWPCHTLFDGDVVFAVGLEDGSPQPAESTQMCVAVELAVERAILDAITSE